MGNIPGLKNLCNPAEFYLVVSVIALVAMAFQNYGNNQLYCIGLYSCDTPNVMMVFILKLLYVLFWTWILNILCRGGAPGLAWFLVLIPYILLFIFIAMFMVKSPTAIRL